MKFLAVSITPDPSRAQEIRQSAEAEAEQVWRLISDGSIREAYLSDDGQTAFLLLEAADEQGAREVLATLPMVQHGLLDWQMTVLRGIPGLERLLEMQNIARPHWWP